MNAADCSFRASGKLKSLQRYPGAGLYRNVWLVKTNRIHISHWGTFVKTKNISDLAGKIIIVTGGNSGLGLESVKAFAQKGAEVILTSRNVENGEKVKNDIGKVIGKEGRIAMAMRTLLSAVTSKDGKRIKLEILD